MRATIDWRGLCEELVNELHGYASANPHHDSDALVARARAALAQPEPEAVGAVEQIAQIVYERAMVAAVDAASRQHWPLWAELPESDARTHAITTAQAILTSGGYSAWSETETAERPAVTLRTLLHPGFEPGDGNVDGAQLVDGQWHVPVMGCDSLQIAVDNARAALDRPKPNRLTDALARIREVSEQANTSFRPFADLLYGKSQVASRSEAVGPTDEEIIQEAIKADLVYRPIDEEPYVFSCFVESHSLNQNVLAFARAVLARYGRPAPAPAEGEVAELVDRLRRASDGASAMGWEQDSWTIARAAELLERQAAPVPVGMIPVEYMDLDSGARIVSEPSEEGPGGCWVVLNSRLVNPLTEFLTAEAAWNALQAAHALPLPQGEAE